MIKYFIQGWREGRLIVKTIKKGGYYTNIDELPVYNFFKLINGELKYLWIKESDYKKKYPEGLFLSVLQEMYYQFPYLDNSNLRDKALLEDYKSKWLRTKDFRWKNEYKSLEKKLTEEIKQELKLDDFTDYIEHTFKSPIGSIDTKKVSTLKAFSNYYKAIKKNKKEKVEQCL